MTVSIPDLDNAQAIHQLVHRFYDKVLADPVLQPVFLDVAGVDLSQHLGIIERYWRKMLLGEKGIYQRHTMNIHKAVHEQAAFRPEHFERWAELFHGTVDELFAGPYADRAHHIADRVLVNMGQWLGVDNDARTCGDHGGRASDLHGRSG